MQKQIHTQGIILRKIRLNEADQILTVLTVEHGKIHCIAKGSQKITSKFTGRLELLSCVDLILHTGKNLETLRDAEISSARVLHSNTKHHGVLFYLAEITDKLVLDQQQIEGVYALLTETLELLDEHPERETLLFAYLIRLLTTLGFMPSWDTCCRSGEMVELNYPLYFSPLEAGVVRHPYITAGDIRLPMPMVKWIHFMQKYSLSSTLQVQASMGERLQLWSLLKTILQNLLTQPVRSENFLELSFLTENL